jgi:hypothetical protein
MSEARMADLDRLPFIDHHGIFNGRMVMRKRQGGENWHGKGTKLERRGADWRDALVCNRLQEVWCKA